MQTVLNFKIIRIFGCQNPLLISEYAVNGTSSEKWQFPKLAWQKVRDDLCKWMMILPSYHSVKQ